MAEKNARTKRAAPFPTREEIRRFIRKSPGRVGKREIARAFGIGPDQKPALRGMLRELKAEGATSSPRAAGASAAPGALPEAMVVRDHRHRSGWRRAWPGRSAGKGDGAPPLIFMAPERARPAGAGAGRAGAGPAEADRPGTLRGPHASSGSPTHPGRVLGVYRAGTGGAASSRPTAAPRRNGSCRPARTAAPRPGEIVLAEPLPHHRLGLKPARIIERLGAMGDARSVSLIVHPHPRHPARNFRAAALAEAEGARAGAARAGAPICATSRWSPSTARTRATSTTRCSPNRDRRRLPPDRRDRRRRALRAPRLARSTAPPRTRGNSVYFPDRVVPMLPEALSNGWCSLRPDEDRGCLFVELRIDAHGPQDRRTASAAA